MKKSNNNLKLWISAIIGAVYLCICFYYILTSGPILWAGISAWIVYPHIVAGAIAVCCTMVGAVRNSGKLVGYSGFFYSPSGLLFPPFHVFLLVPALLLGWWHLTANKVQPVGSGMS